MEIATNKINGANAEVSATVLKSELEAALDKLAKQLSQQVNIPGFRKGKVPPSAVKKQHGEKLVQDAESETVREALEQGLKALGFTTDDMLGEPQFTAFDKQDSGDISFTIKVATRPIFDLGDYKAKVPDFEKPEVTDAVIDARIEQIAKHHAATEDIEEDRGIQNDDTAIIDFKGFVDGEAFDGGTAEEYALAIGGGQFIPGFEAALIGMKAGEEKTIDITFPEDYGNDTLAGKAAQFEVKLHKIQVKAPIVLDDALAKTLLPGDENATMDTLKAQVKTQLENEAIGKLYNEQLKPQLLETIVASYEFDLPEFVVEQEIDMALNNKAREMSEEELNALKADQEKVNTLRETLREDATRSVKATFLIDALAKAEGISVNDQEVMQTIYYEAMQTGQDPQGAYNHYQESGYLPAIQMAMVEDKVLSGLLNAKTETEASVS